MVRGVCVRGLALVRTESFTGIVVMNSGHRTQPDLPTAGCYYCPPAIILHREAYNFSKDTQLESDTTRIQNRACQTHFHAPDTCSASCLPGIDPIRYALW